MKLVIGAANFTQKYGLENSKIASINNLKKILAFCKSKNINMIDDALEYGNSKKIYKKINLKNFDLITKIKLPKNYRSIKDLNDYYLKTLYNDLKRAGKKNYSHLLAHEIYNDQDKNKILIDSLKYLKKKKLTKKIGVSAYNPVEIKKILKIWTPEIIQLPFNVFDQRLVKSKIINYLYKKKIEIHVRSIFLQGTLLENKTPKKLMKYDKYFKNWHDWCVRNKINKLNACIHFIEKFNKISAIVIGINNLTQLKEITGFIKRKKIKVSYKNFTNNKILVDPRKWN